MPRYEAELLDAAASLLQRTVGQKGRLAQARIRRSVSTSYYAIFLFICEDAARRLVGASSADVRRRRVIVRQFEHGGVLKALNRVNKAKLEDALKGFFGVVVAPSFVLAMATTFADAQAKRHDADYNLIAPASELDARKLIDDVRDTISVWRAADAPADRTFKHGLALLLLLKGVLRSD